MSQAITIQPDYDITVSKSDTLRDELLRHIQAGEKHIVIDFSSVQIIDSTGLSVLISAHNTIKEEHPLELVNVSDDIKKLLAITRLDKHFKIN
ncbi:MAG: anti-sigma factor antagonist [Calditrichaeota bacterium]|nr:MAG: anti-sigma factor antagonist [Calditrichota bacterium]